MLCLMLDPEFKSFSQTSNPGTRQLDPEPRNQNQPTLVWTLNKNPFESSDVATSSTTDEVCLDLGTS
jgi:hypothetical protein